MATASRPALTDAAFDGSWFRTGDVVRREAGYLYFVDRLDDIVLSGGETIAPSRVEAVLTKLDGVEAAAVFGTPHERLGEAVTAAIVGSDDLTTADVEAFCDVLGLFGDEKPRRVHLVDSLPRTGSQKVDKSALADRLT